MAISSQKKTVIKVDYEAGLLTKVDIANKHKIDRKTLYKMADDNQWVYGRNSAEIHKATEQKTLDSIIGERADIATEITNQFLKDSDVFRNLILGAASDMHKAYKDAKAMNEKVAKDEFDRIFAGSKVNKINLEALNIRYMGVRKALGMDREEELKRSMPKVDPTEGLTEDQIEDKIAELQ